MSNASRVQGMQQLSLEKTTILLTKTPIPLVRHVIISSQSINQTVLFMS